MTAARHFVRRSAMRIRALLASSLLALVPEVPPERFTIVLLPDTQYYSLRDPLTYRKQAEWIVANRDALNITFVIHLGDITDKNGSTSVDEWKNAHQAHLILDNAGVPYSVTTGNHELPEGRVPTPPSS